MKKFFLFFISVFTVASGICQSYDMRNYEWDSKPVIHKLSDAEQKEPAVILKDDRVTEYVYNKDGDLEEYSFRHRIIHINEEKSIEEYNRIYVSVLTPDQLISFKARSISKDGKVKEMFRGEMKDVTEKGHRYLILAVDGLEKNGELEFFYSMKNHLSYYKSEEVQSGVMAKNVSVTLISPENLVFTSKSYNGFPDLDDTLINKKRYLKASTDLVPPAYSEKYAAYDANLMRVEIKLTKNLATGDTRLLTWADAGKRYYSSLHDLQKNELKDAEKLASKLKLKNMKDDEQKVMAIENFIKSNINMQESEVNDLS